MAFVRALGEAAAAVLAVTLLTFLLIRVVPGDPVTAMLGEHASAGDRAALVAALGLDRPLTAQLADYYRGLARGDAGQSLSYDRPVAALIAGRLPATAALAGAAVLIGLGLGLPLGAVAALRAGGRADRLVQAVSLTAVALPTFVLGPLLAWLLAVELGWLPLGAEPGPAGLALPALTLGLGLAGVQARVARASVLDALAAPHLRTARAKGLSPRRVFLAHVLRCALLPVVTLLGLEVGALLGGAVLTEAVFGWPGLGSLFAEALQRRDYPLLQGCVLVIAGTYVVVNALTELAYALLDPRVRAGA